MMKSRNITIIIGLLTLATLVSSCMKVNNTDDKNKIDIKGSMTNGDMRSPNIEAYMEGKTLWVYFYEAFGNCDISITNREGVLVTHEIIDIYEDDSWRFYMGDEPLSRYHLVISNGTDEAEGWFFNFRFATVRPTE